jgi:phosphatidylserine synthase
MVSTLNYPSFKNLDLRRRHKNFNLLVSVILVCVLIAYKPSISFFPLMVLYICSGPIITIYRINSAKKLNKEIDSADASESESDGEKEDISHKLV